MLATGKRLVSELRITRAHVPYGNLYRIPLVHTGPSAVARDYLLPCGDGDKLD